MTDTPDMSSLPPLPPPGGDRPAGIAGPSDTSPGFGSEEVLRAESRGSSRRPWIAYLAAAVVMLLVGFVAGAVIDSGDGNDETAAPQESTTSSSESAAASSSSPESSTTDSTESSATTGTGVDDSDGRSDPVIDSMMEEEPEIAELMRFVSDARGRPWSSPVVVEMASEGEFQERLLEDFEEDRDELETTERIFRALGFLEDDSDLAESLKDLLSIGVVGFYDPTTKELVIRGDDFGPYARTVIVHELVHAFDDQHFDLDREELEDADDESGFAFSSLVEGNARRVENQYRATMSREESREALREEMALGSGSMDDLARIPMVLLDLLIAPYELGEPFAAILADGDGEDGVDNAFAEPPLTSSEILHPERYLDGFEFAQVEAPPAPAEVTDQGVFGELLLGMLLNEVVSSSDALRAAEAWAGDWYVSWQEADRTCIRVDFASVETGRQRERLEDALGEWASDHGDATLDEVGDLLRLTACG